MHYFIDGYNVIHKSSSLQPLAMQDFETARETLIDRVAQLCATTQQEATIVFDGQATNHPELAPHQRGVHTLHVYYSPKTISADAVIERRVYQTKNRLEICVVSNDRGLRDLCRNLGALTMEADAFLDTVREIRKDVSHAVERTQRPDLDLIQDRLDDRSLEQLRKLRDKL